MMVPGNMLSPARRTRAVVWWMLCAAIGAGAVLYGATKPNFASWVGQLRPSAPSPLLPPEGGPTAPAWVASAPGRVEPLSGEVRIDALILGRVAEVLVNVNDRVDQDDLLVRLEDEEAIARLASVEAQVAMRERERDGVTVTGPLANRRKAEDKVAAAERALAAARRRLDRLSAGHAAPALLAEARESIGEAKRRLERARDELARTKANVAKIPGPLDTALAVARAELSAAEAVFEKTRVRSPFAGTILQLTVRAGEVVAPQRERPLAVLADISQLRVRADLDERNWEKVRVGQLALVRSESFAEPFKGKVIAIAPALGPGQTASGGRRRPQETRVVEVLVEVTDSARLMSGMQVDVFFLASDAGR
jgi:HlyD family secretion protein